MCNNCLIAIRGGFRHVRHVCRHSIFNHIRRLPDCTPAHIHDSEARRAYRIRRHHTTAGIAQLVGHGPHGYEPDCAGLRRTLC